MSCLLQCSPRSSPGSWAVMGPTAVVQGPTQAGPCCLKTCASHSELAG